MSKDTFVIVCTGSRSWTDRKTIAAELVRYSYSHDNVLVVQGKSPGGGADAIVEELGETFFVGYPLLKFENCPMDPEFDGNERWNYLNRNKRMLDTYKPDIVLAFRAGGKSNGTDHTIAEAKKRGIEVVVVSENL